MIKVHALKCGAVGADEKIPNKDKSKNPLAVTGLFRENKRIWLPVYAFLIEHPKGNVLIDTGWHTDVRTNQRKHLTWKINIGTKAKLPEGQAITEQLNKLNINIKDIDTLLLTHLDVDHASGIQLVKDIKNIYVNKNELKSATPYNPRYNTRMWENITFKEIPMKYNKEYDRDSFDLFNDGTIEFVDVSGHSEGTTGAIIKNNNKFIVITSDSCYNSDNWLKFKLPGITTNNKKALESLKFINNLSKKTDCIEILPTHDNSIKPHTIEL